MTIDIKERLAGCAFAFRGYNVTNLGRSAELLAHPQYGPIVKRHLETASQICSEAFNGPVDLVARVHDHVESTLESFGQDIGIIVAIEMAQMELLREYFDIDWKQARLAFGYSLGEVAALIASDVYKIEDILPAPLSMARECAELGRDVTMGVLFSRGAELNLDAIRRLCLQITNEGKGVIAINAYLSPNTLLLLGQHGTVDLFKARMHDVLPRPVHLRKNNHHWPPLHTPILWECNLTDRAAVIMNTMKGGFTKPEPTLVSLVTGKASYNDYNSREILNQWIDHPQRLWDAVCDTLAAGVEVVVHVGPDPNLIPATFKRLSENVTAQLKGRSPNRLGLRALSRIARRRTWLANLMSSRAALLRAPFVEHVSLEDWLLDSEVPVKDEKTQKQKPLEMAIPEEKLSGDKERTKSE